MTIEVDAEVRERQIHRGRAHQRRRPVHDEGKGEQPSDAPGFVRGGLPRHRRRISDGVIATRLAAPLPELCVAGGVLETGSRAWEALVLSCARQGPSRAQCGPVIRGSRLAPHCFACDPPACASIRGPTLRASGPCRAHGPCSLGAPGPGGTRCAGSRVACEIVELRRALENGAARAQRRHVLTDRLHPFRTPVRRGIRSSDPSWPGLPSDDARSCS